MFDIQYANDTIPMLDNSAGRGSITPKPVSSFNDSLNSGNMIHIKYNPLANFDDMLESKTIHVKVPSLPRLSTRQRKSK